MASDRDQFFAQMRARMAARRGAPLAKAAAEPSADVPMHSTADGGSSAGGSKVRAASSNAIRAQQSKLLADRNKMMFNYVMGLHERGTDDPDEVYRRTVAELQKYRTWLHNKVDKKYVGEKFIGKRATKTAADDEKSFIDQAISFNPTKKEFNSSLLSHARALKEQNAPPPAPDPINAALREREQKGIKGKLSPAEKKLYRELSGKMEGEDISDEESGILSALEKKKAGDTLGADEQELLDGIAGGPAKKPAPVAAPEADEMQPESADGEAPAAEQDPDMMQPEPEEEVAAPKRKRTRKPAAAPVQGDPDMMQPEDAQGAPAAPSAPAQEEQAPAPLAGGGAAQDDEQTGGQGDQAGEQAEMARQAMQSEGNAEHEIPSPAKQQAASEPAEQEPEAPQGAPAEQATEDDRGGGADAPPADGPPVEDSPPDETYDPDMMEPEPEEEREEPAPIAARSPRPARGGGRAAKPSGRTFKVGRDDQPDEQFSPKGENGAPVPVTGNVTGGGAVTRKQGLALRTEKGPRGGFYEITQTGNRRRISQAEYQERQGKNNRPRHSSYFDQNPDAQKNGPLDGYSNWHEAESLGHKPFHSSNVEGGRAGMHTSDANREEYHEHLESQKAERRADRAANEAISRHAHSYERPDTPRGHYLGKKNLSAHDVAAHIRTLSEFTGIEGKNGHRFSWVVEPKYQNDHRLVDGKKVAIRKRTNSGGGHAIDFDIKEDENGGVIVTPKLLTYHPTKKKLSAKQIAYLIATGQIHPVSGRHDPSLTKDFGAPVEISAEELESGNLHKLNSLISHCAEYAHNQRGAKLNRQLHNLFEAHGATHHNWRYDQLFNTMGRGGSKGSSGRPGEQRLAASLEAQRRQLALHLGPNWREKIDAALVSVRHGGTIAMREVNGENYLHDPLMLPIDKAIGTGSMIDGPYDMGRVTRAPADPLAPGVGPRTVRTGEPRTRNHSRQGKPVEARRRAPKTSEAHYRDVNGGLSPGWRPDRAGYDGMGTGLQARVMARLKQTGPRGMFDGLVHAHTWSFSSHLPLANVHGGSVDNAEIERVKQQLLDGVALDPIVVIQHGGSYHVIAGEAQIYAARAIGAMSCRCFVGSPKASAPLVHTTDIALKIPKG